jgi:uncharacterized protein (DUF1501 family)
MAITRRQFLKRGAATAAAATVAPRLGWLSGTNVSYASGPGDAIVVFVQLYGGNDGINMVYPVTGAQRTSYETFRPTLKLPKTNAEMAPWVTEGFGSSSVLSIGANDDGSTYALHPAMGALHGIYQSGKVAVLPGVHYPFADHSHFRSEVIWYTVDPLGSSGAGWFGKYLDGAGFGPTDVPGVMLGDSLSPLFTPTQTSLFAFDRLSELRFPAQNETVLKQTVFGNLYAESALAGGAYPELAKIGQTGVATVENIQSYYKVGAGLANAGPVEALLLDADGDYDGDNPLVYASPLNPAVNPRLTDMGLARDLRHVAATIRANVGARFFHVAVGGFDSHANQEDGFYHSYLLNEVSESLAAFYGELNQSVSLPGGYSGYLTGNVASKVVILTFSEFGRTIRQNSRDPQKAGTDHATAAPHFVIGGSVVGGQYGAYPQLDDPGSENEDDLRMTWDFRDVFGTILSRWLNVDAGTLGPGPGKILVATPDVDADGRSYTTFTPIPFLPA